MPRVDNTDKARASWKPKPREPPIAARAEDLHRKARAYLLGEEAST